MSIKSSTNSITKVSWVTRLWNNPWLKTLALTLGYLAILLALVWLYGKGDFSTPPFVYQGF